MTIPEIIDAMMAQDLKYPLNFGDATALVNRLDSDRSPHMKTRLVFTEHQHNHVLATIYRMPPDLVPLLIDSPVQFNAFWYERMQNLGKQISHDFPGLIFAVYVTIPNQGGRTQYISNGERQDMINLMKEMLERFQKDTPGPPSDLF